MNGESRALTTGSVVKGMLLFAVPIFMSNLFQQLYNAVDSLIVGNFIGEEALAAVSSSGSLIMLLTGFINGVSMGAGVLIARFYGAQDKKSMERTVHTTVALGVAAGLLLTVVGVLFTPQILRWMGTPETVLPSSIAYFRTYFLGSVAVILYNVGASILQSVGDSRSPMKYLIIASITNVVALALTGIGMIHSPGLLFTESYSPNLGFVAVYCVLIVGFLVLHLIKFNQKAHQADLEAEKAAALAAAKQE